MPSSNASEPLRTSQQSPDTLPLTGYTCDQLSNYILRQLGSPTWQVELSKQHILDAIQDGLQLYGQWRPTIRVGNLNIVKGVYEYLKGADVGLGIAEISFVEPNPVPSEVFYSSMISPAPIFRTGLDEYDSFLRWRKVWSRVTSVRPDWFYDEARKCLLIHNPIERYQAGVFMYDMYKRTEDLDVTGSQWVKEFSLEQARYTYGEVLAKFSGAVPGPLQAIVLDQQKRGNAQARLDKLRERLQAMQMFPALSID
jgi:hypothetical protein